MRSRVIVTNGWGKSILDTEPLPAGAVVVSEHDDPRQAADAFDKLSAALRQARDGAPTGTPH